MFSLIRLFFALPALVYVLFAAGVYYAGDWMVSEIRATEAAKAEALTLDPPAVVLLEEFSRDNDIALADEINISGQINPKYNDRLVREGQAADTERHMFVLFGTGADASDKTARAAILLRGDERGPFANWAEERPMSMGEVGPIVEINGRAVTSPMLATTANAAMREAGLKKSADFVFIEPFIMGRAVALAPTPGASENISLFAKILATLFVLAGLQKFLTGNNFLATLRTGSVKDHEAPSPHAATDIPVPGEQDPDLRDAIAADLEKMSGDIDPNTPLGRLKTRRRAREKAEKIDSLLAPRR